MFTHHIWKEFQRTYICRYIYNVRTRSFCRANSISGVFFFKFWWLRLTANDNVNDREPGPPTRYWHFWQCVQVPGPAREWNQHSYKAGEQEETSRALKTVLVESALTLGLMEPNASRWHGSSTITETPAAWNVCVSTPPPDSGTLISTLNAIFTLI